MKKLFHTLSELLKGPRNVVDAFLFGENRLYSHPFVFMTGVSILVTTVLLIAFWVMPDLPNAAIPEIDNDTVAQIQYQAEMVSRGMFTKFLPVTLAFLFIPSLSLGGLVFFRNELNGFYDNLILSTYLVSGAALFSILCIPFYMLYPDAILSSSLRITVAIAMTGLPILWMYYRYFPHSKLISVIRQVSTAATGYIIFIVLSGFVSGVIGYMIFAIRRIAELSGQG